MARACVDTNQIVFESTKTRYGYAVFSMSQQHLKTARRAPLSVWEGCWWPLAMPLPMYYLGECSLCMRTKMIFVHTWAVKTTNRPGDITGLLCAPALGA